MALSLSAMGAVEWLSWSHVVLQHSRFVELEPYCIANSHSSWCSADSKVSDSWTIRSLRWFTCILIFNTQKTALTTAGFTNEYRIASGCDTSSLKACIMSKTNINVLLLSRQGHCHHGHINKFENTLSHFDKLQAHSHARVYWSTGKKCAAMWRHSIWDSSGTN